jgi:peptidoglycan/LPS O-acetylase OafA/YrhL
LVECLMYLFFPMLVFLGRRFRMRVAVAGYIAAGYAMAFATRGTPFAAGTWQYLGAFALGALAADISYGGTPARQPPGGRHFPWYGVGALCVAFVMTAIGTFGWRAVDRHIVVIDLPVAIAVSAALVGASREPGTNVFRRALQWRPLAAVGLFSYSLYIVHFPLADVLERFLVAPLANEWAREAVLVGVVVPILIAAAYGFYRLFEKPFHQLARRIGREPGRSATRAVAPPHSAVSRRQWDGTGNVMSET